MGEDMEVKESVVVKDPESGRMCRVFFNESEVNTILTAGLTYLLTTGVLAIAFNEGTDDGETPEPGSQLQ